jgi:hypothetical protein
MLPPLEHINPPAQIAPAACTQVPAHTQVAAKTAPVLQIPALQKEPDVLIPVAQTVPLTCSLSVPLSVPVPINTFPVYWATFTKPVSKTSMLGIPETSFTENMVPDMVLATENN